MENPVRILGRGHRVKIDFNALQEVENGLEWEQWWASEWEPSYEPNCLLDANQRQKQVFPLITTT